MPDNPVTDQPFFLTRQIANLMEDFAREISRSSSVFLLYGDALVGKSRVLDELSYKHFNENVVHRIDFSTDKYWADEGIESTEENTHKMASEIQRLMQDASDKDIIIIDHFELASNKARHQVFQSWATDGLDKRLNLIIAADSSHFDEVRQLANQYQASVKSFQLKPFSWEEIEAFVLFYLFPAEPSCRLSIPADIQKQFKHSRGLIGRLIEIVSREGIGTAIKFDDKPATYMRPIILVTTLSAILLVGTFLYPLSDRQDELPSQSSAKDVSEISTIKQEQAALEKEKTDLKESPTDRPVIGIGAGPEEPVPEQSVEPVSEAERESGVINQVEDTPMQVTPNILLEGSGLNRSIEESDQKLSRFQQELSNSLNWIEQSDKKSATIQIMSIAFDSFVESAYYLSLDELAKLDIDVSRIRIYQTNAKGRVVYSVVYGEYENQREANKSIQQLPDTLKANKPIPRTIGGIWDEINQQESQN